jgi:hypothetical protein
VASVQKATLFKPIKKYFMPVVKITSETNLLHNETRYFIRIDGKFIQGFNTLEKAEEVANQIAAHGGKEKTEEITIKEIIC